MRRDERRDGFMWWRDFQTEYRIWSRLGAEVLDDLARAWEICSYVRGR